MGGLQTVAGPKGGPPAIEYAVIGALIVVACIGAFGLFGDTATNMWDGVSNNVTGVM